MKDHSANAKMVTRLLFRLLPAQILLSAIGAVNGIVSSYFASNYVGVEAMSAVGQYSPVNMLLQAISTMLVGGLSDSLRHVYREKSHRSIQGEFCRKSAGVHANRRFFLHCRFFFWGWEILPESLQSTRQSLSI